MQESPRIIISERMNQEAVERLRQAAAVVYEPDLWRQPERLAQLVAAADALVVRNQTRVTGELLSGGTRLRVVGRLGVGLDNIDRDAARRLGITVVAARGANATAVAEYVVAALFYFARRLHRLDASVREGQWRRDWGGSELYGKTLGLVGLGDIGQRVAWRVRALGMTVVATDPVTLDTHWAVMEGGVRLAELDEVLASAHAVSLHVPLTAETRHLLNAERLQGMRPGAWLINTARGGVVDEAALLAAVQSGRLGGAALDVREVEPPPADDPLAREPAILLTPHIAGLTAEADWRTGQLIADDVLRVLRGEPPRAMV